MAKIKKTISFNTLVNEKIEKIQRVMQFKDFSHLVNYICDLYVCNPEEIARRKAKDHQALFYHYKQVLDKILDEKESVEEVSNSESRQDIKIPQY